VDPPAAGALRSPSMSARALADLGVAEALSLLRRRQISSEELVRALLARVELDEPRVEAFALLDAGEALRAARRVDRARHRPPLAGLPVAVKDIIDTAGMATERGTPIHAGRVPEKDAEVVARLRAAGAVILGKTVTTEFAYYRPGKTRNPHDPARTPGGSSSGSAAAVAAGFAPAALGTQTAGSVIRPASYCGVVGMKLTHGAVPLEGVSPFAPSLDTLGVFARHPRDLPPLLEGMGLAPRPGAPPPGPPRVGLCRTDQWALATPAARAVLESAARAFARAGAEVREVGLGSGAEGLFDAQKTVMAFEAARGFAELRRSREKDLSPVLLDLIRSGEATRASEYAAARACARRGSAALSRLWSGSDVLLTPAAAGEAPLGLGSTGDPAFNRIWTLLGAPCVAVPAGTGPAGMPIGVQLVGACGGDHALAAAAAFAADALSAR